MSNIVRIKRRSSGGVGAPSSLQNAELAYNEIDDVLYYGKGSGGLAGSATTVEAIAGQGAMVTKTTNQTISGNKTFTGTVGLGAGATATTPAGSDNSTSIATTAFVKDQSYLTGNQTVTVTGDATGSGATSIALTLANSGITAGTYTKIVFDAKGRATSGGTLTESDIPSIHAVKVSDFDTQVRTSRLDQMALATADVSINGHKLTNLLDPVSAQDAATKAYVDATKQGLDVKDSVRAATTASITLTGTQTLDGVVLSAGDRVLVKDQTTVSQNGIYVVAAGAWTRSTDADATGKVTPGMFTFVEEGTVNHDSGWVLITDGAITVGTTSLSFTQFSGAGQITAGAGLTKSGNTIDVNTADATRIVVNADSIDLATTAVTPGTYFKLTVDGYGRSTAGANPTTLAGFGITDAQGVDATLTALAGLTTAADQLIYATGVDAFSMATLTAYARTLIAAANAAAARTALGLGTVATQDASNVAFTGGSINGLTLDNVVVDGGTF